MGEPEKDRDKMLLELEQECLEAYRRKVDQASRFRAQLIQAVADTEAELAHICASLGEQPLSMKQVGELVLLFHHVVLMHRIYSLRPKVSVHFYFGLPKLGVHFQSKCVFSS